MGITFIDEFSGKELLGSEGFLKLYVKINLKNINYILLIHIKLHCFNLGS